MASFLGSRHSTVHLPTIVHADVYLDVLCCAAVALDRWESLKVAWMAKSADRGVEDMEAAAQEDHLLPRATEGPAVALLHSDAERREFISAGAAAGLAVSPYRTQRLSCNLCRLLQDMALGVTPVYLGCRWRSLSPCARSLTTSCAGCFWRAHWGSPIQPGGGIDLLVAQGGMAVLHLHRNGSLHACSAASQVQLPPSENQQERQLVSSLLAW